MLAPPASIAADGGAQVNLARTSPDLRAIVRRRAKAQDDAVESLADSLDKLHDTIGRRLLAALGLDPDDFAPAEGDDGRDIGATAIEATLRGVSDGAELRAAILSTELLDVEELIDAAGLDIAGEDWKRSIGKVAAVVESTTASVARTGDRALDNIASEAALQSLVDWQSEALFGPLRKAAAVRIMDALRSSAALETTAQVAQRIQRTEPFSEGQALTEARTRIAEADRYVGAEVQRIADPDGTRLLLAYMGPDDRITRPFCDRLVGKAFTAAEFELADNAQTPSHPRIAGGGYNCRHVLVSVPADALGGVGVVRGGPADIAAANAAAIGARKRKGAKK